MSTTVVQVAVVLLFALTCGVLAAAWLGGRLGVTALGVLLVAAAAWILALAAIGTESGSADDFATCSEDCGAVQYVSAVAFIAPPLLVAVAALAILVARGSRWRARRASGGEPA